VENLGLRDKLEGQANKVRAVAFSPDGKYLASAAWGGRVVVWSVDSAQPVAELAVGDERMRVRCVAFLGEDRLVSGDEAGQAIVWDWRSGERVDTENVPTEVVGVVPAKSGDVVYLGGLNGKVWAWDLKSKDGGNREMTVDEEGNLSAIALSPDGQSLATAGLDGTVRIWDPETGERLLSLVGHAREVKALAFRPDGKALASGSLDGTVRIWEVDPR
jgi:WD40 repeat protein